MFFCCSKCAEAHLRTSVISKVFPGVIPPDLHNIGEGRRVKKGRGQRERAGKIGEGKEKGRQKRKAREGREK